MTLLIGAMVVFVVTTIVVDSYLFGPVRRLAHRASPHLGVLFGCFLCMGTWVGWLLAWWLGGPTGVWFADGLAFHGLALLAHHATKLVEDLRVYLQR